jgi:hypothetical protein
MKRRRYLLLMMVLLLIPAILAFAAGPAMATPRDGMSITVSTGHPAIVPERDTTYAGSMDSNYVITHTAILWSTEMGKAWQLSEEKVQLRQPVLRITNTEVSIRQKAPIMSTVVEGFTEQMYIICQSPAPPII